jgi:hypothetical protein
VNIAVSLLDRFPCWNTMPLLLTCTLTMSSSSDARVQYGHQLPYGTEIVGPYAGWTVLTCCMQDGHHWRAAPLPLVDSRRWQQRTHYNDLAGPPAPLLLQHAFLDAAIR